jgi:hypothetical protein
VSGRPLDLAGPSVGRIDGEHGERRAVVGGPDEGLSETGDRQERCDPACDDRDAFDHGALLSFPGTMPRRGSRPPLGSLEKCSRFGASIAGCGKARPLSVLPSRAGR